MSPKPKSDLENTKLIVEAWKVTIDVQKHFNDLELRVRNFAITLLAAILAAVGLGIEKQLFITIGSFTTNLAVWFMGVAVVIWVAFGVMDGLWYHRLLEGAVKQGEAIETELAARRLRAFMLTTSIADASHSHRSSSRKRMFAFYAITTLLLAGAMLALHYGIRPTSAPAGP